MIYCKCDKDFPYHDIKYFDVALPVEERIFTEEETETIWLCPKCKKENRLIDSRIVLSALQEPYYHRIVPSPPKPRHGLLSKLQFDNDMSDWVWMCLNAIEEGFTRFRDDNWNKADPYDDNFDIDTSIEESQNAD